ncbi:MAG TPA: GDP-mannose 4,6-dehydratase [Saprospiraceae bacterium]|nr:GDP-mannose 4,6-dehydratase [Saprospiraceae bacterium]HPN68305.1 GDP-mannose 4,6-dehydratase [Saprospiraceae bacterium]
MDKRKTAIITGITGQDGAFLSELLLDKGYHVMGIVRSLNSFNKKGLEYLGILDKVEIVECSLLDFTQISNLLKSTKPSEIYNLAAQSSVSVSFKQPIDTFHFNTISVINLLEAIKLIDPSIKFYQASSSEMFGDINQLPILEDSIFHPKSPYAISKASAHWLCVNYRESYGLFISCGILFNHESYLRSDSFFIKKVLSSARLISEGKMENLTVGNIDIKRDFGYAPKYVEAMYKMLQHHEARNFLVCSGQSVSLRDIIYYVFDRYNLSHELVVVDEKLIRPAEIPDIYGSPENTKSMLHWDYDFTINDLLDKLIEEEEQNK